MADRPVFYVSNGKVWKRDISFTWYAGFAVSQKQKSIQSLHAAIVRYNPALHPLEISTKSENALGQSLSAFRLKLDGVYLENVYQSSKVFAQGGPYRDLLETSPKEARRDERLKTSGKLIGFDYAGTRFGLSPKSAFYDYLYLKAVLSSQIDVEALLAFNGFTDIEFNPARSNNTQARSAAIVRLLLEEGLPLAEVIAQPEEFVKWHQANVRG